MDIPQLQYVSYSSELNKIQYLSVQIPPVYLEYGTFYVAYQLLHNITEFGEEIISDSCPMCIRTHSAIILF